MIDGVLLHDVILSLIATGFGGATTFWVSLRRERRDDTGAQAKLTGDLLDQVRKQLEWSGTTRAQYAAELEILRAGRFALEDLLLEMRDQALAARAMVHERERALGMSETVFAPLPRPTPRAAPPAPMA